MKAINFIIKLSSAIANFYNECTLLEPQMKERMEDVKCHSEPDFVVLILETEGHQYEQEIEINQKDEFEAKGIKKYNA